MRISNQQDWHWDPCWKQRLPPPQKKISAIVYPKNHVKLTSLLLQKTALPEPQNDAYLQMKRLDSISKCRISKEEPREIILCRLELYFSSTVDHVKKPKH